MDDPRAGHLPGDARQPSDGVGYRSYVVRVWSQRAISGTTTRVQVEDVQSGRLVELRGEAGAEIHARISAAVDARTGGRAACRGRG